MNADMPDNGQVAKFARYIGIDYSGAQTPRSSLPGLRVYLADGDRLPIEVLPPPSPRKYWTRRGVAEWLVERLGEPTPTLVGIDHAFSFPLRYFEVHRLQAQLAILPRRLPATLAHGRRQYLRRFRARWHQGQRRSAHRQPSMATTDGGTRAQREVGFSLRRAGVGGQVDACGVTVASFHPAAARRARSFLAIRRVGCSFRPVRHRRGLSPDVERELRKRAPYA